MSTRIHEPIAKARTIAISACAVLIIAWGYHATATFDENLARYQPKMKMTSFPVSDCCKSDHASR